MMHQANKHKSWLAMATAAMLLAGCGAADTATDTADAVSQAATEAASAEAEAQAAAEAQAIAEAEAQAVAAAEAQVQATAEAVEAEAQAAADAAQAASEPTEPVTVRVGALKGPTSIGLAGVIYENEDEWNDYEFTMETQADVLLASVVAKDLDIALIPANVASVLYNKTSAGISVIDINTLGVLYMVSGDDSILSMSDLAGKTIYTTGKGSTPEYALNYLLSENGLTDDVTVEYKSEATEVAATLAADPTAVGMLPQPFATVAQVQNDALGVVLDMTAEWDALDNGSQLLTGVTIVRNEFLEEEPEAVARFLADHARSVEFVNSDTEKAAEYVADMGIIEKAPIAQRAIPYCNIVCITGDALESALSGYLSVLYDQDPSSVGGELPGADFYFIP